MSKFPILVILAAALATSAFTAQPMKSVSVDQLAQILAHARGQKDKKVAKELSGLKSTQRISAARLKQWETEFPGKHTRQALTELADASVFLDLPPSEVLHRPAPDLNSIKRTLNQSVAYVIKTIHTLPNFYALRTTTRFENAPLSAKAPPRFCSAPNSPQMNTYSPCVIPSRQAAKTSVDGNAPLVVSGKSTVRVTYVDGKELDNGQSSAAVSRSRKDRGLVTSGEFGPILAVVLHDALTGKIAWGHWEPGASGSLAVFVYSVLAAKSHYFVTIPSGSGAESLKPAYHGEISIDPASGAIHRITAIADGYPKHEHMETSIMVRYGSVVIGGKPYICPVKGVALSRLPLPSGASKKHSRQPEFVTRLNDITFTRYHLFRGEVKILPNSGSNQPAPGPSPH